MKRKTSKDYAHAPVAVELDGLRLLRPRTLAELWDMSPSMVYKLIVSGELKAVKVGRSMRISEASVNEFLEKAGVLTIDGKGK